MPVSSFKAFKNCAIECVQNAPHVSRESTNALFSKEELEESFAVVGGWPGYEPTPLKNLPGLAGALGVASISYKDESGRFGLGSFKALGGAYAVSQLEKAGLSDNASLVVATATDGNHGRSVAWGAKTHGYHAVIFIHAGVSQGREDALRDLGAEVIRVSGNYDDSVKTCCRLAGENDWIVVSDTTHDNSGADVARTVMLGYSVMPREVVNQLANDRPTHVFVQGGVGGLAATVCEFFRFAYGVDAPYFVVVEPDLAPCLLRSAKNNARLSVDIQKETIMAGLSCGEPSSVAWPTLSKYADCFMTIPDSLVAPTMRLLGKPPFGDDAIIAGESAVAGLGALIAVQQDSAWQQKLKLSESSRVLLFGTEGATDPVVYETLMGNPSNA